MLLLVMKRESFFAPLVARFDLLICMKITKKQLDSLIRSVLAESWDKELNPHAKKMSFDDDRVYEKLVDIVKNYVKLGQQGELLEALTHSKSQGDKWRLSGSIRTFDAIIGRLKEVFQSAAYRNSSDFEKLSLAIYALMERGAPGWEPRPIDPKLADRFCDQVDELLKTRYMVLSPRGEGGPRVATRPDGGWVLLKESPTPWVTSFAEAYELASARRFREVKKVEMLEQFVSWAQGKGPIPLSK